MAEEKEEKKAPPSKKEARKSKRTAGEGEKVQEPEEPGKSEKTDAPEKARKSKRTAGEGEKVQEPEEPGKSEKTDAPEKGPKRKRKNKRKGKRNRQCWARKAALLKKQAEQEDGEEEDQEGSEEEGAAEGAEKGRRTKANRLIQGKYDYSNRGVIFIGQLPKGFEEKEMKQYFRQFGTVTRHRLARSQKTGRTKSYGWVEFEEREVAEVVAKTMNKYMMFGKVLQVVLMSPEEVPRGVFRQWHQPFVRVGLKRQREFKQNHNDRPTVEVDGELVPQRTLAQVRRRDKKMNKLKEKLEQLGIEYDLTPFLERHDEERAKSEAEYEERKAAMIAAAEAAEAAKAERKAAAEAKRAAKQPAKEPAKPAAEEAPKASNVEEAPAKGPKGKKAAKAAEAAAEEAAEAPEASGEATAKKKKKRKAAEAEEAQPSGEAEGAPEKKKKKKKAQEA